MRWIPDRTLDHLRSAGTPDLSATQYELVEEIGKGGMGTVYRARDTRLERRVALKVLDTPDSAGELAARLVQEAKVLARLEHPGIVPIHDAGELPDGRLFYAMKFVDGERLDHYAHESRSLPERLRTFSRICEAVAFAHSQSILHRDLKPQNIMVGSFGEVLVMDWGVAKLLRSAGMDEAAETELMRKPTDPNAIVGRPGSTEHGAVLGTPGYMSPEQAKGEVDRLDARADVYSLGAVLRFLLLGPRAGSEDETAVFDRNRALVARAPASSPASALPRRLRAIVGKAMEPEPERRYETAADLARDVERYLDGQTVSALPESLWSRTARFVSTHRVAFILIAAYVVVRTLVLLFFER